MCFRDPSGGVDSPMALSSSRVTVFQPLFLLSEEVVMFVSLAKHLIRLINSKVRDCINRNDDGTSFSPPSLALFFWLCYVIVDVSVCNPTLIRRYRDVTVVPTLRTARVGKLKVSSADKKQRKIRISIKKEKKRKKEKVLGLRRSYTAQLQSFQPQRFTLSLKASDIAVNMISFVQQWATSLTFCIY